jgi:hypothetical protein
MEKSFEAEKRADSECLLVVMSGKTWYVPFDELQWIPRVGENIQISGGGHGKVSGVEYEFTPGPAPARTGGEMMPQDRSYVRPRRIVVSAS